MWMACGGERKKKKKCRRKRWRDRLERGKVRISICLKFYRIGRNDPDGIKGSSF